MAVIESQKFDLTALVGAQLVQQWNFFQDDADSVAWDFTGYTFSATLWLPNEVLNGGSPLTLASGSGLTITNNPAMIQLSTPTVGWTVGRGRWYLTATDSGGEISYPLRGLLFVGNP